MKSKFWSVAMVLGVFLFVLSACAPVAAAYVKLDPALADWVLYGATVLVGFVFVKLSQVPAVIRLLEFLRIDPAKIEQYKFVASAWLAGVVIQFLQAGILDKIPTMWGNVVTIVMQLVVAVIVTLYSFQVFRRRGVQGFR